MKSLESTNLRAGMFVFLGLVVSFAVIIAVGGQGNMFSKNAVIKVKFEQVQGLAEGSLVSLAGVVIGNINRIEFQKEGTSLVISMDVKANYLDNIPHDSKVEIRTQGALGDKFLYILPGADRANPIHKNEFLDALNEQDLFGETQKFIQSLNAENKTKKLLEQLYETSVHMHALSEDIERNISPSLRRSLGHFENIARKIDEGDGTLGKLVNDPSIFNRVRTMLGIKNEDDFADSVLKRSAAPAAAGAVDGHSKRR